MAFNQPIIRPFLERRNNNAQTQKAGRGCGSNVFAGRTIVALASGVLIAVATGGTAVIGWSAGPSLASTDQPPKSITPGNLVYPFDLSGETFMVMSTTDSSVNTGVTGTAASAPAISTIGIGTTYGIITPTTGVLAGVQMVNLSDTTNTLLTVVAIYPNQASSDLNGKVLVRVLSTRLQA